MRSLSSRYLSQTVRRYRLELALALFAAANVAVMLIVAKAETIPFHFIWLSLAIPYGFRAWRVGSTLAVLGVVCVVAGGALAYALAVTDGRFDELAEVPMMAAMFLAVVWHAQRRQAAIESMRLATMRERDIAHQLCTPISIARGHAELVELRASDRQVVQDTQVILEELDRLTRISDRMRSSRWPTGAAPGSLLDPSSKVDGRRPD
jgi:signal transduction histidine kinase